MPAHPAPLPRFTRLAPYTPGLSIDEIAEKYGLANIIKLASNENPLGASPRVVEAIRRHAPYAFRYPQGGNPALLEAIAKKQNVAKDRIAVGNGSDEIIDLLIRMMAEPGKDNIVCFKPCFSLYPIQAEIAGVECRRQPLEADFSFNFQKLLSHVDENTRLVFITTPDNPSGFLPPAAAVRKLAADLGAKAPGALLAIDEAYMDFAPDERSSSLLYGGSLPENMAIMRTFSKSYGLAGLRLGYAIMPAAIADCYRRARLPFSVNILAEHAALAALEDKDFHKLTLETVKRGRQALADGMKELGCQIWPSAANFIMFSLPDGKKASECFDFLLKRGIIIRPLKSYGLPDHLRVSVGAKNENRAFLQALGEFLR